MSDPRYSEKLAEAKRVIAGCIGKNGLWASTERYKHQCWTRDFALAGISALLLGDMEHLDVVLCQLEEIRSRQLPDGRIPILYLDDERAWLTGKIETSIERGSMSFMLKRYLTPDGVGQLTPWTKDSEILYALASLGLSNGFVEPRQVLAHAESVARALQYVETRLMKNGLATGGDWRDTRPDLNDKAVLSNNCLLFLVYQLREKEKAAMLARRIEETFWTGEYLGDYEGTDNFDTLGNALAILVGIPITRTEGAARSIIAHAETLRTPYGYKLNTVTLPPKSAEEAAIMARTEQQGVIWPFVHWFMVIAAREVGMWDLAREEFAKGSALPGFYEWYNPNDGKGYGSPEQLWSAAMYLCAADDLGYAD